MAIRPAAGEAGEIEARLRGGTPPVIARVEEGRLLLDLRTILPEQEPVLTEAVVAAATP